MQQIGQITHYFDKIGVGVLALSVGQVSLGDQIQVGENDTSFTQTIESMQVDHQPVESANAGDEVGLKLQKATEPGTSVFLLK